MKERPILFSAPMVLAAALGRKTQTRRVVKPQPVVSRSNGEWVVRNEGKGCKVYLYSWPMGGAAHEQWVAEQCPYGVPGDRLWVREAWMHNGGAYCYRADYSDKFAKGFRWRPSIHMPRLACRITLEVVSVRVERLQEISEADAIAEGVQSVRDHYGDPSVPMMHCGTVAWQRYDGAACAAPSAQLSYQSLWESINGPGSWATNPWVWVVEFKRLEAQ